MYLVRLLLLLLLVVRIEGTTWMLDGTNLLGAWELVRGTSRCSPCPCHCPS